MNHYQVLEVDPGAPVDEIQYAYHRLARRWHPDANAHPDAGRVMAAVNEAWAVLGHPDERRRYDRELGIHAPWRAPEARGDTWSAQAASGDGWRASPWVGEDEAALAPDERDPTTYDALVALPVVFAGASFVCFAFGVLSASRVVLALGICFAVLGAVGFIAAFVLAAGRPALPTPRRRTRRAG